MTDPIFPATFAPTPVVYVDSMALVLAVTDPSARGTRVAREMSGNFAASSEIALYEVPRLVTVQVPDFAREASFMWALLLNHLDLTHVETYDLEMAGARAWGHPEQHAALHVITAEKISASVFVTADDDTARAARLAQAFDRVVVA